MKLRSPLAFCAIAAAMMAPAQLSAQEIPNRSAKADLISYAPAFPALLEEASIEPAGWFFAHEKDHSFDSVPIPIAPAAYRPHTFIEQASDIKWRVAAAFGATLALGFVDWDWGNSSFHFAHEGYFGKNTANGGMDKLGHAFGTMLLADFFSRGIHR